MMSVFTVNSWAQSVDVKGVDTNSDQSTTIEIRKGEKANAKVKCDPLWEIVEGSAEIQGDPGPMAPDARKNWKLECDSWQKQFRADNKENKIITVSCGTPSCSGETANKVCASTATYKIKSRLD